MSISWPEVAKPSVNGPTSNRMEQPDEARVALGPVRDSWRTSGPAAPALSTTAAKEDTVTVIELWLKKPPSRNVPKSTTEQFRVDFGERIRFPTISETRDDYAIHKGTRADSSTVWGVCCAPRTSYMSV